MLIDSSMAAGVIVHIIEVLAFPPRDDCKILVSLESRNGMKLAKKNPFNQELLISIGYMYTRQEFRPDGQEANTLEKLSSNNTRN